MATKSKQDKSEEKQVITETWRKPLQVPPRANAMRSFYKGAEQKNETAENAPEIIGGNQPGAATEQINKEETDKVKTDLSEQLKSEDQGREAIKAKTSNRQSPSGRKSEAVIDSSATINSTVNTTSAAKELTKQKLSEMLGIEIEDLFDVHELLRGKSFEIYQILTKSKDEAGRCKITQPELMKRTGIKNRRTFYKHEEWLIKLNLLEKRHLPGDHKGVVYRILEIADVLPLSNELLAKFKHRLESAE